MTWPRSTGECRWGLFDSTVEARLYDLLHTYAPSEIIIDLPEETAETVRARLYRPAGGVAGTWDGIRLSRCGARLRRYCGGGFAENETVRKALAMFAFLRIC